MMACSGLSSSVDEVVAGLAPLSSSATVSRSETRLAEVAPSFVM